MTSVNSWIAHFKDMSENKLGPGTLQFVKNKGGAGKVYYRVHQPPPVVSPAEQIVKQASAKVSKTINKRKPKVKKTTKTRKQVKKANSAKKTKTKKRNVRVLKDILS